MIGIATTVALSFGIALVFIFVRAPHPWGWEGLDHYDEYARALVRGEPFPTIDRPPGYAYFLALFYLAFGDRPWIPLLVQAALNALLPVIVYDFARSRFDGRVAIAATDHRGLLEGVVIDFDGLVVGARFLRDDCQRLRRLNALHDPGDRATGGPRNARTDDADVCRQVFRYRFCIQLLRGAFPERGIRSGAFSRLLHINLNSRARRI